MNDTFLKVDRGRRTFDVHVWPDRYGWAWEVVERPLPPDADGRVHQPERGDGSMCEARWGARAEARRFIRRVLRGGERWVVDAYREDDS